MGRAATPCAAVPHKGLASLAGVRLGSAFPSDFGLSGQSCREGCLFKNKQQQDGSRQASTQAVDWPSELPSKMRGDSRMAAFPPV